MHGWDAPPLVVGHRGSPQEAVENTLDAFRRAIDAGAPAVELDARLSADDEVFVHHDVALGRTFPGHEPIDALPSATLRRLGVPTLREALDAVPRALVDVELKTDGERAGLLPERAAEVVRAAGALDRVLVTSFDAEVAAAYGDLVQRPVGAIVPFPVAPDEFALLPRVRHVAMASEGITGELAADFARAGVPLLAWTVNDAREAARLVAWGVRSIITDRPGAMVQALAPR